MNERATPSELRVRAKAHLAEWRRLLGEGAREAAREELENANTLAQLAAEAEEMAA